MNNCNDHAYMLYAGKNISEADLYHLELETGMTRGGKVIPPIWEIVDRRKNHAIHYKYCPHCGEKLNWRRFREMATSSTIY